MLYFLGLSILQNGKLPQFLSDKIIHDIFVSSAIVRASESCEPQTRAMRATNASHASHASHKREPCESCEPQTRAMRATNASQPLFIL
jgi:hypothetical protein